MKDRHEIIEDQKNDPVSGFRIRNARPTDAEACAEIHKQEIYTGFLSQLGIRFLKLLYTAKIRSPRVLCFVAEDERGQVMGFVSGSSSVGSFYKEFFAKYGVYATLILLPKMLRPGVIRKIFETVRYKSDDDASEKSPQAELLAIAVRPHIRGKKVSQELTATLFNGCREREIQRIKVVVGAKNVPANKFYKKIGFELQSNIHIHGSEVSNVYVKELC